MTRRFFTARLTPALLLLATACGDPAVVADSGPPETDAGGGDASLSTDTGVEDAGPEDAGAEPELCETEGEMRAVPCGNCGLVSESCSAAGVWEQVGSCLAEGDCAPGGIDSEDLPMCETRQRICNGMCEWSAWTTLTEAGECEAGDTQLISTAACGATVQPQLCSSACEWEDHGGCDDGCGSTARTMPDWAREVCVAAGPFIRGEEGATTRTGPVAEIELSAYYIDAFPVTNQRYRACVGAGVCPRPTTGPGAADFDNPLSDRFPAHGMTWHDAEAFCSWDGGRRLPTEAEWEKAARGPAPRNQPYVWEGTDYRCDLVPTLDCPGYERLPRGLRDAYDAVPGSRSYYGTEMQMGGVAEWLADWHDDAWYSQPESLVMDPGGPTDGTARCLRGLAHYSGTLRWQVSTRSGPFEPSRALSGVGVRCARGVTP